MLKKIILSIICGIVLGSVCADAYAFYPRFDKHGQTESSAKFFEKFLHILKAEKQLNLSEDQVKKIENEMLSAEKEVIRSKTEIKIISLDMQMELKQDKINTKSINKLIDQKYEFKKSEMKTVVNAYAKINDILTKEQKEMLPEIYKNQKEKECGKMDKKYRSGRCPYQYPKGDDFR
ncbi:MAG: Spy/CpxP family protein refolding chaperone [Candidatus Omnitrophota bacterium]